jgi:hypothetical protein
MNRYKIFFGLPVVLLFMTITTVGQTIQGTYAIKNVQTGIVLRIKDANKTNGTPIVAYSPVNWKCVTWDFKNAGGQTYRLVNLFSGKTLQPQSEKTTAGTALEEQPLADKTTVQQYEFIPVEKNTYLIRLQGTELYITPSDDQGTINAGIILSKKQTGKLQYWSLHEQQPTM